MGCVDCARAYLPDFDAPQTLICGRARLGLAWVRDPKNLTVRLAAIPECSEDERKRYVHEIVDDIIGPAERPRRDCPVTGGGEHG
jgi:hypothetical protein